MTVAVLLLLTAACAATTVAVLGSLRQLAELQLWVVGGTQAAASPTPIIASGLTLPAEVVDEVPFARGSYAVAVLSDACPRCLVAADLVAASGLSLAVGIVGTDAGLLRKRLPAETSYLSTKAADTLVRTFLISEPPVVIVAHDHVIHSSAFGDGIRSSSDVEFLMIGLPGREYVDD